MVSVGGDDVLRNGNGVPHRIGSQNFRITVIVDVPTENSPDHVSVFHDEAVKRFRFFRRMLPAGSVFP